MMHIVEIRNRGSQPLDAGSRTVFPAIHGDVNGVRTFERAFDFVVDFGSALAQVGPFLGLLEKAVFVGSLSAPDYSGGRPGGV